MAMRKVEFAPDEWYHCYSRGVEKRNTFSSVKDYERFIESMYLANSAETHHRSDLHLHSHAEILASQRGKPLVAIGAWCLMPNHFHLLMKESATGGISRFMQKLGTAYTMYFNKKNAHVGGVFVKPFRAKHVAEDRYYQKVVQYIHLNSADVLVPEWREGGARSLAALELQLKDYRYSSLQDYEGITRPEISILDANSMEIFNGSKKGVGGLIDDAVSYYGELGF